MKKLLLVLVLSQAGCSSRWADPMPNTGRGFWKDIQGTAGAMVDYHDKHVYRNTVHDLPRAMYQVKEHATWADRFKVILEQQQGQK